MGKRKVVTITFKGAPKRNRRGGKRKNKKDKKMKMRKALF
jgi:hypothetical protein